MISLRREEEWSQCHRPPAGVLFQVVAGVLMVDEGGESPVGSQNLLLSDVDSREEALQVHLQAAPRHGALRIGNVPLEPGHFFTVKDLRSLQMRSDAGFPFRTIQVQVSGVGCRGFTDCAIWFQVPPRWL